MEESSDWASVAGDRSDGRESREAGVEAFPPSFFETVTATIPSAAVVLDGSGAVRYANDEASALFGRSPGDLAATPIDELCPDLSIEAVEAACGTSGPEGYVAARARGADGEQLRVEFDFEARRSADRDWYVGVAHDVTRHRTRERTLEQYERIVETIDDGMYILDDAFNITSVNDAVEAMTGYSESELVGSNVAMLASEETIQQAAAVSEALLTGDSEAATISTEIETKDGESIPVETRFSVYQFDDGSYGQVGVVRDISERIRYEQTLTALHDSTRELLHAETPADVCDLVVDTATDVIDLSAAVVYLFDSDANVLRPAATDDGFPGTIGELPLGQSDSGDLWDAFVRGERRVDHSGSPLALGDAVELSAESGTYIPLGEHGVFFVAMDDSDRLDPDTMQLIELVAASAEAALERVDRDERLRERDRELRKQNEQLRRLQQINEIIRRIDQAMVGADSTEDVETAVCEGLAESDLFSLAWIGDADGNEVTPQAWAGEGHHYLDSIDRSLTDEGGPPSVRTARTDEPTVVSSIAADLRSDHWRMEAISRDFQSVLSVPLRREEYTHGVLTVYAGEQEAFSDTMRSVFAELGETIANALRVVETKQWLSADSVVEVDLEIGTGTGPLARLARRADATLDHRGTIPDPDGGSRAFLEVAAGDADAVAEAAADVTAVTSVETVQSDDDTARIEASVTSPTVATAITERGYRVSGLTYAPSRVEARAELAGNGSVRDLVEELEVRFEDVTLEARRDRQSPARSEAGFRAAIEEALTDRQWQVLRTAHLSGFFEWPRETTGQEIAETFDVSQPTINRHLRVAERKLLDHLFEDQ